MSGTSTDTCNLYIGCGSYSFISHSLHIAKNNTLFIYPNSPCETLHHHSIPSPVLTWEAAGCRSGWACRAPTAPSAACWCCESCSYSCCASVGSTTPTPQLWIASSPRHPRCSRLRVGRKTRCPTCQTLPRLLPHASLPEFPAPVMLVPSRWFLRKRKIHMTVFI